MSTLTSSSSIDEIIASYADNASYEEDGSVTKARAFVTACRLLLLKLPKSASVGGGDRGGGHEMELEPRLIKEELAAAQQWVALNASTASDGSTRHTTSYSDFTNFRD